MTDRDATDEVISAFLDGEVTDDEAARVRADPELLRRLEELRVASRAVAQHPEPPAREARDAAIARALGAYDEAGASTHRETDASTHGEAGVKSTVRPLVRRRRVGVAAGLSAAAIVALLALAVPLVALLRDGDERRDLATSAPEEADTSAEDLLDGDAGGAQEAPVDLGAVDGPDDLRQAVGTLSPSALAEPGSAEESTGEGGDVPGSAPSSADEVTAFSQAQSLADCETDLRDADDRLGALRLAATAIYQGTPAFVYVFELPDGSTPIHVVASDSCEVLTVVPA